MSVDIIIDKSILIAAVLLSLLAMYTDVRWRIIPNRLTLPAIGLGLLLNTAGDGWQGSLASVIGLAAGFGLMLLPYLLGGMGAGDVKLMGALGALLGGSVILNVFLYGTIIGGILAVFVALRNGSLQRSLLNVLHLVTGILICRTLSIRSKIADTTIKIPYGIAIGAGVLCYFVFGAIL